MKTVILGLANYTGMWWTSYVLVTAAAFLSDHPDDRALRDLPGVHHQGHDHDGAERLAIRSEESFMFGSKSTRCHRQTSISSTTRRWRSSATSAHGVDHPRMRGAPCRLWMPGAGDVVKFPTTLVESVVEKMRDPANQTQGYTGTLPINLGPHSQGCPGRAGRHRPGDAGARPGHRRAAARDAPGPGAGVPPGGQPARRDHRPSGVPAPGCAGRWSATCTR